MKKFVGIVTTEHPKEQGVTVFIMRLNSGKLMPCRSAAGYDCVPPKLGDKVAIIGDTICELISGGETEDVYFNSLEVLESALKQTV